jgi:hypothetical protein
MIQEKAVKFSEMSGMGTMRTKRNKSLGSATYFS